MVLSELFKYLSYGELSQLSLGTGSGGEISESDFPTLAAHVNLGLSQIYTRLPLKQEQTVIALQTGISTYTVDGNVIKIEQVVTEKGTQLPINDPADDTSVFTPAYNQVQVPNAESGNLIAVIYRAGHDKISLSRGLDANVVEVDLPDALIEALLSYVVGRVLLSRGAGESANEGATYLQRFELAIQQYENTGLIQKEQTSNTRLEMNGWR